MNEHKMQTHALKLSGKRPGSLVSIMTTSLFPNTEFLIFLKLLRCSVLSCVVSVVLQQHHYSPDYDKLANFSPAQPAQPSPAGLNINISRGRGTITEGGAEERCPGSRNEPSQSLKFHKEGPH